MGAYTKFEQNQYGGSEKILFAEIWGRSRFFSISFFLISALLKTFDLELSEVAQREEVLRKKYLAE